MDWSKMAISKRQKITSLVLLAVLGLCLLFFQIDHLPSEFRSGEALLGWRAKFLSETGKDETGRFLPLIFSSLDGYQLPFPTYFLLPIVKIFGLNKYSVRLPFVLFTLLGIFAFYKITKSIFPKDERVAFWAALILITSPGIIWMSRTSSVYILALSLFLVGWYFFLNSGKKENSSGSSQLSISKPNYWLAVFFLSTSLYTVKVTWLFIFPFLLLYWICKRQSQTLILFGVIFLIFLPLFFSWVKAPQAKTDLLEHDLTIFNEISLINGINQMRGEDNRAGYSLLGRILYNKLFFIIKVGENFLRHFNPRFYFASGDGNPFHGLGNYGPMPFIVLFPVLMGIGLMYKKEKKIFLFLILLFVLGIINSVFSLPSPDTEKALLVLPILSIWGGYYLNFLKPKYLFLFGILLAFNLSFIGYDAVINEPRRFSQKRAYGFDQVAEFLKSKSAQASQIFLTDTYLPDPGPLILFYQNYPSLKFQEETKGQLVYRYWINRVGKIIIGQKDLWRLTDGTYWIISPKEKENQFSYVLKESQKINQDLVDKPQVIFEKSIKNPWGEEILEIYFYKENYEMVK